MIGLTRGTATLVGAAIAGTLLWFATQVGAETSTEYWATYGLIAAAGLAMALSQIVGGWTKWGLPSFSFGVFLLGFLPVLAIGTWVLLARQPADWMNTSNWSRDLGVYDLVADLGNILPAIAFGIGLTFGLSFDTAGRRTEVVEHEGVVERDRVAHDRGHVVAHDRDDVTVRDRDHDRDHDHDVLRDRDEHGDLRAADEPLTADRDPYAPPPTVPVGPANADGDVRSDATPERRVER